MQIKVYCPTTVEIPSEFLPAIAKRAAAKLGQQAHNAAATRGHLVRQAVLDGLIRKLDHLIREDGSVDLVSDPAAEAPLELNGRSLTLTELLDVLQAGERDLSQMPRSKAA